MKFLRNKTFLLILGAISILALLAILASLSSLTFKPAKQFVFEENSSFSPNTDHQPYEVPIYVFVAALAVLLVAIFFLLPRDARKKYLWTLLRLIVAGVIIFLILSQFSLGTAVVQPTESAGGLAITQTAAPVGTPVPEGTPEVFTPPHVPSLISYLVGLVILLVAVGLLWWFVLRPKPGDQALAQLADIARATLLDLEAGRDWGDTVLTCYYRMTRAAETWRGIHRRVSMTPAEFSDHLISSGLPEAAVRRLTALFERVRYGDRKSNRKDVKEATESLQAILVYCEGSR